MHFIQAKKMGRTAREKKAKQNKTSKLHVLALKPTQARISSMPLKDPHTCGTPTGRPTTRLRAPGKASPSPASRRPSPAAGTNRALLPPPSCAGGTPGSGTGPAESRCGGGGDAARHPGGNPREKRAALRGKRGPRPGGGRPCPRRGSGEARAGPGAAGGGTRDPGGQEAAEGGGGGKPWHRGAEGASHGPSARPGAPRCRPPRESRGEPAGDHLLAEGPRTRPPAWHRHTPRGGRGRPARPPRNAAARGGRLSRTSHPPTASRPGSVPRSRTPAPAAPHRVAQQGVGVGGLAQLAQLAVPVQQRRLLPAALAHLHGGRKQRGSPAGRSTAPPPACPACPPAWPPCPPAAAGSRRAARSHGPQSSLAAGPGAEAASPPPPPPPGVCGHRGGRLTPASCAPRPRRPAPAAEDRQSGARSAAGRRAAPQSALGPRTAPAVECGRGLPRRVTTGGKRGDLPLPPVPRAANRAPGAPGATGEPANAAATRLQPPRAAPPPRRRACEGRRWLCEEGGAAGRGGRPGLGRGRSGACRPGQLPAAEPPGTAGPPGGGASPAPSPAVRLGPPAAHGLPPRSRQRAEAARGAPRPRERAEAAVEGGRGRASSGHRGRVQGEAAGAAPHPHPALPLRGSGKLQWGYGCSYRPVGLLV